MTAVKIVLICLMGVSFGMLVSAGVFTVLFVVGLVPRFSGKTNTARSERLYEESRIFGSVVACVLSVFPIGGSLGLASGGEALGWAILLVFGIFSGRVGGCLSIALAEVLDGLPIFARRVMLKKGLEL